MLLQPEVIETYHDEMRAALDEGRVAEAVAAAENLSSSRAAEALREAPSEQIVPFLLACSSHHAGRILGNLPPDYAAAIMEQQELEVAANLVSAVPPDHAADILQAMPPELGERLLASSARTFREAVGKLLEHPAGSAGAHMTSRYLTIGRQHTVGETLAAVRSAPAEVERSTYVYVTDAADKPVGVVSVRDLLRRDPKTPLARAMTPHVVAVSVTDSAVQAAELIRNRRFTMLPVLALDGTLAGIITFDDAMDIVSAQVAGQFAGVNAGSVDESFFTPPLSAVKLRLPWMAANVFLNLGAVAVISSFEETIAAVAILAAFLPMITDMGGNVGIQSLSVAIRSIALGEVRLREFWRAVRKELAIGIVNGLALGALFMMIATFWQRNALIGAIAGIALATNVLVAGVVGGTIPFLIKRLGKDPAMMTGPLLTTITDITGVTIYLGLSTILLLR